MVRFADSTATDAKGSAPVAQPGDSESPGRGRRLDDIAATLDDCIDEVSAAHLGETAALLSIARLDLMARIHRVTEPELDQLECAVGRRNRLMKRLAPDRSRRRSRSRGA